MTDRVITGGWAPSPAVQEALRTVPRRRFAPEQDLKSAYDDDLAVVTRRNEAGRATSSVFAAWLQADMIEGLGLKPGALVWEAGCGGCNAELLAQVVGPSGRVVTSDIDEYVVRRARRFLVEAGSGRDAALGVPARFVPRDGFDAIVITYNCCDVAPPWRELLAEGGRLVLPWEIGGYPRAITFQRGRHRGHHGTWRALRLAPAVRGHDTTRLLPPGSCHRRRGLLRRGDRDRVGRSRAPGRRFNRLLHARPGRGRPRGQGPLPRGGPVAGA
ncbi:hypothetical protein R1T08_03810 [Streptomyces sp. SBC-4]|nr:hypothetical protein [Streptomyces sp. SBC-4]MDV5143437.1 hypothetical protein [Streptomyces sp. SBC-4]